MKLKDYCYLALLNSLRNKKRTIRIITGFVVGISFLILTLFLLFSTHFTSMDVANKNKSLNSISFSFDSDSNSVKEFYENLNGIEKIQKYGYIRIGHKSIYTIIDGSSYLNTVGIEGMATDDLNSDFMYSIDPNFIVTGDASIGKKEIMLSEKYIKKLNLNAKEVIGQKISILAPTKVYLSNSFYLDNDEEKKITCNDEYISLMDDFIISGIYVNNSYAPYSCDFIIGSNSFYNVVAKSTKNINYEINYYYEHNIDYYLDVVKKEGKLLLFNSISSPTNINIERIVFESFEMTLDAYYRSSKENKALFSGSIDGYINYKKIVDSLTIFFTIVGIIVSLISMLSLFSVISYNIEKKHTNIGILKALGAKDKEIFVMNLVEFSIYFFISFVISFVFTLVVSFAGVIIVNKEVLSKLSFGNLSLRINIGWYFLALFVISIMLGIISYLYTIIATRKVSKEKIMKLIK